MRGIRLMLSGCDVGPKFGQFDDVGNCPRLLGYASRNRRSRFEGLMNPHEIIVHVDSGKLDNPTIDNWFDTSFGTPGAAWATPLIYSLAFTDNTFQTLHANCNPR